MKILTDLTGEEIKEIMEHDCYKCKHKAKQGYINCYCLACKWSYYIYSEAFERKANLYEEKGTDDI